MPKRFAVSGITPQLRFGIMLLHVLLADFQKHGRELYLLGGYGWEVTPMLGRARSIYPNPSQDQAVVLYQQSSPLAFSVYPPFLEHSPSPPVSAACFSSFGTKPPNYVGF